MVYRKTWQMIFLFCIMIGGSSFFLSCTNSPNSGSENIIRDKQNRNQAWVYFVRAKTSFNNGFYEDAFRLIKQSLSYALQLKHNQALLSKIYLLYGNYYYELDEYVIAYRYYHKVLNISESNYQLRTRISALEGLGLIFNAIKDYNEARKYYWIALEMIRKDKKIKGSAAYLYYAYLLQDLEKNDSAIFYYHKARSFYKSNGNRYAERLCTSNISMLYEDLYSDSAVYYLKLTDILAHQLNNENILGQSNAIQAQYEYQEAIKTNNSDLLKQSYEHVLYAYKIAKKFSSKRDLLQCLQLLYQIEKKLGDDSRALAYFEEFSKVNAKLEDQNVKRIINENKFKNDLEQTKKEALNYKDRLNRKKIQVVLLITLSASVFLMLTLLIYVFILQYKSNLKNKKIDIMEKQKLQEQLETEHRIRKLEKEKYVIELESKNRELINKTFHLINHSDFLNDLEEIITNNKFNKEDIKVKTELLSLIHSDHRIDNEWDQLMIHFQGVHLDFFKKMKSHCPSITEHELRLCAYIKINLSSKDIAKILNINPSSVKICKFRLKKKLKFSKEVDLTEWIKNL